MNRYFTILLVFLVACTSEPPSPGEAGEDSRAEAPLTRTKQEGPVSVSVSLTPAEPLLGDPLILELAVESEAGVAVEMPAFGEALGRFSILDFVPREVTNPDGSRRSSHRYTLQAPMSGRQRIPPLRMEYLDSRTASDADPREYRELLSDELTVNIASVIPDGAVVEDLLPARGALPEFSAGFWRRWGVWIGVAVLALGAGYWLFGAAQRRAQRHIRETAYERAVKRLAKLESEGLPAAERADGWYVELSDIVRRYIEDQFGVRAPELTTEEFLQEARRSVDLTGRSQELLSAFLERCDRVKFAAYSPQQDESAEALGLARNFLDTRPTVAAEPA